MPHELLYAGMQQQVQWWYEAGNVRLALAGPLHGHQRALEARNCETHKSRDRKMFRAQICPSSHVILEHVRPCGKCRLKTIVSALEGEADRWCLLFQLDMSA